MIKVVPENYFPYFKIGNLFFVQNKLNEAIYWFKKAIQIKDQAFLHAKLGMVYLNKKLIQKAKDEFLTALDQQNKQPQLSRKEISFAYYYLSICYLKLNKPEQAKKSLQQALTFEPTNSDAKKLFSLLKTNERIQIEM